MAESWQREWRARSATEEAAGGPQGPTLLLVHGDGGGIERAISELERRLEDPSIVTSERADDALDLVADGDVDIVVSDAALPDGDGLALLDGVRDDDPDLPVVLRLPAESEVTAGEAVERGATDVVRADRDDEPALLVNRVRNALERHRARRAVTACEWWYEELLDAPSDVITVLDREGRFRYVSPSVRHVLGYEPADLRGEAAFDYVHPDDRATVAERFFSAARSEPDGQPMSEFRFRHADGSWRTMEGFGRKRFDEGVAEEFVISAHDITKRKERERELKIYETIVEANPDSIYALDADFRFIRANDVFERRTGMSEEAVLGEHVALLVEEGVLGDGDLEEMGEKTRRLLKGEVDSVRFSNPADTEEGRMFTESRMARFPDRDDQYGLVVITRDITERKRYERQLERQNDRLDEFASVVSHDLRNPLNIAQGRLDMVAEECDSPSIPPVREALERMETQIEELLQLSRQGQIVENPEPLEFAAVARDAWETVAPDGELDLRSGVGTVLADEPRLRRLLENLFRNSDEHAGPGVTVRAGPLDASGRRGFYVADDGPGLDPELEVFERGVSSDPDGTGFGLSIVDGIAEAHGWEVTVAESWAGGARFEVAGVEFD